MIILNVLNELPVSPATRVIICAGWRNKKAGHSMMSEIMIVTRIIPRIIHFEVRNLFNIDSVYIELQRHFYSPSQLLL